MDIDKKIKRHKTIYITFLVLAMIGLFDVATSDFVSSAFDISDADFGLVGLLFAVTGNTFLIIISSVLLAVWPFLLIIALLERRTWKKLKQKSEAERV